METSNSKEKKAIIIGKWILSLLLIIGGIGFLSISILSGIFIIIASLLIIPSISDKLKQKISIWNSKRYIRIIVPIAFVCIGAIASGDIKRPEGSKPIANGRQKEEKASPYQPYINNCEKKIVNLKDELKKTREGNLAHFDENKIYKKLVDSMIVSAEYIPLIDAISEGTIFSDEKDGFTMTEETRNRIKLLGKEELDFVTTAGCIGLPVLGGYTKELIDVFERYQKKYGYYGEKKTLVGTDGSVKEDIKYDYDFSSIFGVLDPQNPKVLNAIYESRKKGISSWYDDLNTFYPYLTSKSEYIAYIKRVYHESPYIPKWAVKLSASELYVAYEKNEVSADNQYKDKIIAVTGVIENIGKDVLSNPYVTLKTGQYLNGVNCYFSDDKNNEIARLSKKQKITIQGECDGFSLLNVIMRKCEIEE